MSASKITQTTEEIIETTEQGAETAPLTYTDYDGLILSLKREQSEYKKDFLPAELNELNELIEMCWMPPKAKKENMITKEKVKTEILKFCKKRKKYKNPENIFDSIRYLAVQELDSFEIGRLVAFNYVDMTCEYYTYNDALNKRPNRIRHMREIRMFDYNSIQLSVYHNLYIRANARGLSEIEVEAFLTMKEFRPRNIVIEALKIEKGYGIELVKAEDHPIIKEVMLTYSIPITEIVKQDKKLQQLHIETLEVLGEFDSVKDAEDKLGIKHKVISNILCQGNSAIGYMDTGGYKWQWSNEINAKYHKTAEEIKSIKAQNKIDAAARKSVNQNI